jgi:UDP-N-acetylmuramyl pentapeptide synthase
VMVLEMAMRGVGQIAELCRIAEPNVAAITNVGPVHLELLGTIEAIAEAKAEILAVLGDRGRAVVPVDAEALEPHLDDSLVTITFGPGGDVFVLESQRTRDGLEARHLRLPLHGAIQPPQRDLRRGDRRRVGRARGRDGASGAAGSLLAPAW